MNRKTSTKAERRFFERLKSNRIPYKAKVKIQGREIDFLVGRYAIDINGHQQDTSKNEMLAREGYIPVHISNKEVQTISINYLKCLPTTQTV